jgi:hypothetical protein
VIVVPARLKKAPTLVAAAPAQAPAPDVATVSVFARAAIGYGGAWRGQAPNTIAGAAGILPPDFAPRAIAVASR